MSHPTPLDLQSVQGTMLIPLWGRAKYSAKYRNILQDKDAMEIIRKHSFDFPALIKPSVISADFPISFARGKWMMPFAALWKSTQRAPSST